MLLTNQDRLHHALTSLYFSLINPEVQGVPQEGHHKLPEDMPDSSQTSTHNQGADKRVLLDLVLRLQTHGLPRC